MTPIIALLIITTVSLLIIRIGSLALTMTGLSQDAAGFQALSAFFGVGFTTRESELVVNHPVRRKIIRDLIIAGNVGVTTVLATVVVSRVRVESDDTNWWRKALVLGGGLGILWLVTRLAFIQRVVDWTIQLALRNAGVVRAMDYDMLLRIAEGYSVAEIELLKGNPLIGKTLGETRLRQHGVVVLGISRDQGGYVGVPNGETLMSVGDVLNVYGRDAAVRSLAKGELVISEPQGSAN